MSKTQFWSVQLLLLLLIACTIVWVQYGRQRTIAGQAECFEPLDHDHDKADHQLQTTFGTNHKAFMFYLAMAMEKSVDRSPDPVSERIFLHRYLSRAHSDRHNETWHQSLTHMVDEYAQMVQSAIQFCRTRTIVICGLIRQNAHLIPAIRQRVQDIARFFKDYHVVIVENNSTDETRPALLNWAKDDSKVAILCDNEFLRNQQECQLTGLLGLLSVDGQSKTSASTRIFKMSALRNLYVRFVRQYLRDHDVVMVLDMDLQGTLPYDGVMHAIHQLYKDENNLDAMACNGQLWNPVLAEYNYYDSFAFVGQDQSRPFWTDGSEKRLHDWFVHDRITDRLQNDHRLLPVTSAFGGCALYKMKAFLRSEYNFSPDTLCCEHSFFHASLNMAVDPHFLYLIDVNE